ncbi:hypothetical protein TNIN_226801 [Trichonephila inaurata madagascariensis]|uniref:Uncharacterized protein n=1 Tax=Trichonephila inaurata madagascariensis TaxID=2747483 RepID=A0A8X6X039_9ARAC|nr:hypothetical protein TNIN_226801 [Trichonephila inaurata madagascariensis]
MSIKVVIKGYETPETDDQAQASAKNSDFPLTKIRFHVNRPAFSNRPLPVLNVFTHNITFWYCWVCLIVTLTTATRQKVIGSERGNGCGRKFVMRGRKLPFKTLMS